MSAHGANSVIPFTHVGVVLPFVSYLERLGAPTEGYLQKARISPALLEHPEAPIPLRLAHRFINESYRAEGIENPALHAGRATSLSDLGEFGKILLSRRNVLDYLETGARLIGDLTSVDAYQLEQDGQWLRFIHRQDGPGIPESDKQHSYLFSLAVTINTLRHIVGQRWCPPEITLPAPGRQALAELSEWLPNTRVVTGSPASSFLFPSAFLALPMPQPLCADSSADATSIAHPAPTEFLSSLQLLAEHLILDGYSDMEAAAEAAGLSVRTLRRRLGEFGTSYSDVVARTRVTLAERWLAEQDRSITDIASALGYANRSNFARAFRRLNGMSPQAYRHTVIQSDRRKKSTLA